jgi:hypothetical protein
MMHFLHVNDLIPVFAHSSYQIYIYVVIACDNPIVFTVYCHFLGLYVTSIYCSDILHLTLYVYCAL